MSKGAGAVILRQIVAIHRESRPKRHRQANGPRYSSTVPLNPCEIVSRSTACSELKFEFASDSTWLMPAKRLSGDDRLAREGQLRIVRPLVRLGGEVIADRLIQVVSHRQAAVLRSHIANLANVVLPNFFSMFRLKFIA